MKPLSILIIGTSDGMVDKIVKRLDLPEIDERIDIEDITSEEERQMARKQRDEMGQHVIPAPTFQLKRQFSGYSMTPVKMLFKELVHGVIMQKNPWCDRPTAIWENIRSPKKFSLISWNVLNVKAK